jgi:hypothetical protein
MRHVREVLRLRPTGVSGNRIARHLNLAPSTARLTLQRLTTAGLDWPLPAELTDASLEAALLCRRHQAGPSPSIRARLGRGSPRAEAQVRHTADHAGRVHRAASRRLSLFPFLRAVPHLGTTAVDDDATGPRRWRQAVCRLRRRQGASDHRSAHWQDPTGASFSRCLASPISLTRGELDIGAQLLDRRSYHGPWAIGGVPGLLVPDNTKVAIIKACLYEAQINRTYAEMAVHYDTAILPARTRRPRNKANGSCGADYRALTIGPAAPSPLLQPGRAQCSDR